MSTRNVIVASAASNKAKQVSTSATTWGEFKTQIADLITGDVEAVLKPGNVTLTRDDAALPDGDFRIYLIPTKNKAGMTETQAKQLGADIAEAIALAAAKATSEEVNDLKSEIVEVIEDFFGVDLSDEQCAQCAEALNEARSMA